MAIVEIPQPWYDWIDKANLRNPQSGQPSVNALSLKSGVHASTIYRLIRGWNATRGAEPETIQALADALNLSPRVVAKEVGRLWSNEKPYIPPAEANMLEGRERKILDELIRSWAAMIKKIPTEDEE